MPKFLLSLVVPLTVFLASACGEPTGSVATGPVTAGDLDGTWSVTVQQGCVLQILITGALPTWTSDPNCPATPGSGLVVATGPAVRLDEYSGPNTVERLYDFNNFRRVNGRIRSAYAGECINPGEFVTGGCGRHTGETDWTPR